MFIQTEATPNPATLKFLPGQSVMRSGSADFPSAEGADASPLASRIFAVDGVVGVFLGPDFVSVSKNDTVDWAHIKPAILGAVMEHYQSGDPVMAGEAVPGSPVMPSMTDRMVKWLARSRNCWTRGYALQWLRMVVTSRSTALTVV